jgi:hypothetical protein
VRTVERDACLDVDAEVSAGDVVEQARACRRWRRP